MRKLFLMLVMFAALFAFVPTAYADNDFSINNYGVDITVNKDGSCLVKETLDVKFHSASHGIYRKIPKIAELNGEEAKAKVSEFEMLSPDRYSELTSKEYYIIKIGDPNSYAPDEKTYSFSYRYSVNGIPENEFRYFLIGPEWENHIQKADFNVVFPGKLDKKNIRITNDDGTKIPFKLSDGKTVKGSTEDNVSYGLLLVADIPEGYFEKDTSLMGILGGMERDKNFIKILLIALGVLGMGVLMWLSGGLDPRIVETVEFYPPHRMTPVEIGFLYEGSAKDRHVISMFLSLADKGFIKILDAGKEGFAFMKTKEYDGASGIEKTFMEGAFQDKQIITINDLKKGRFYETVAEIKERITRKHANTMYDVTAKKYSKMLIFTAILSYLAFSVYLIFSFDKDALMFEDVNIDIRVGLFFLTIPLFFIIMFSIKFANVNGKFSPKKLTFPVVIVMTALVVGISIYAYSAVSIKDLFLPYMVTTFTSCILSIMAGLCEKRTLYYSEILGKIRGYRNFLKKAEKNRVELLAKKDPQYFSKSFAYAYSLDVVDEFIDNFDSVVKKPPAWYIVPKSRQDARLQMFALGMLGKSINGALNTIRINSEMLNSQNIEMAAKGLHAVGKFGGFSGGGGMGGGGGGSW